ncbi:ABC transporter substrate-binding protein [Marinilongibacter aquaticus]|uniref:ABC transporter substrate-binding protein n=1 Tax=Marinilongibacter aquaticus TaxID=2975157 RepID=UPI0021BDCA17|nr:ABC transporter substrate-binding protein [Marinilongibacter aquaticus]UBM59958.1 ABC transporter substrate-binding protein [Marinilongibacter aquaticus]
MRKILFLLLVFAQFHAFGQYSSDQYYIKYKEAVQHYASDDYESCLKLLTPLTSRNYHNDVTPYVLYYFSAASNKLSNGFQARATLRDLLQRFPDWNKIDEAYFLYGYVNLKDDYFDEGLKYLNRIQNKDLKYRAEILKKQYFSNLKNVTLLKELNQKYPTDRVIAENLVNRIQERTYNSKEDLKLSDLLTNRFKLFQDDPAKSQQNDHSFERAYDDQSIDIGALLPFELSDFNIEEAASSKRYVYDLYEGMKMAEKKLNKEGIPVRVYGFDVDKTSASVEPFLKDKSFKVLDVVVGPLYGKPNELVENYAEKNNMIQLHPISNNSGLVANGGNRFLIQASNKTIAESSLNYVESLGKRKSVCIYHDGSRDDLALATVYAQEAEKRGYEVLEFEQFQSAETLQESRHPGHVFFSCNSNVGPEIMRAVSQKHPAQLMLANSTSFNFETMSRSSLKKDLYIIDPQFVDKKTRTYIRFKQDYVAKMNALPSYYAMLGYDMVLYYGRMLKDGKSIFRLNLDENPKMDDLILSGFDYSDEGVENKIVPIVKYENGSLSIVNLN